MDVGLYLERIGFSGTPRCDLDTLRRLHRQHLLTIPFENFDVHLGHPLGVEEDKLFQKLILGRRGGWCYELNVLFAALLVRLGFKASIIGIVNMQTIQLQRSSGLDAMLLRHPAIRVEVGEVYLADVGSGHGPLEPLPFPAEATGFTAMSLPELHLASDWMQSAPMSPHKNATICSMPTKTGTLSLRNRQLQHVASRGAPYSKTVESAGEYVELLGRYFGIVLPNVDSIWAVLEAQTVDQSERRSGT